MGPIMSKLLSLSKSEHRLFINRLIWYEFFVVFLEENNSEKPQKDFYD